MTYGRVVGMSWLVLLLGTACQKQEPAPAAKQTSPEGLPPASAAVARVPEVAAAPVPSGNDSAISTDCDSLCQRTVELNCKSTKEKCKSRCSEMAQLPVCPAEMAQVFQCLKTQAIAHFECDDEGMPAIRSGFCEMEQAAFAKCVSKGAPKP